MATMMRTSLLDSRQPSNQAAHGHRETTSPTAVISPALVTPAARESHPAPRIPAAQPPNLSPPEPHAKKKHPELDKTDPKSQHPLESNPHLLLSPF
jgi:hypothetical protein